MTHKKLLLGLLLSIVTVTLGLKITQAQDDDEGIWWASWHPSGELLAVSYRNDNTVHLLDATTLQVTQTLTITNPQMASAVSTLWGLRWIPDGNKIALGASLFMGGEFAQLVDVNTGQALWTVNPVAIGWDTVSVIDWSPDGTELLVRLREDRGIVAKHQVQIWNALTMEPRLTIRLFDDPGAIAWSPDASRIVTSVDNTPVVWDAETGAQLFTLVGHAEFVAGAQWSPDMSRIATGGENVRIWDALTGQQLLSIETGMSGGHRVNWSPNGTRIAIRTYSDGRIWDAATNQLSSRFTSYSFLLWRPAGDRLVTRDYHNRLSLVDPSGTYISVSPIAAAGPDQTLTDADTSGSEPVTLDGTGSSDPDGTIVSYAWTENEVEIASGATPSVELGVGVHTIILTVTDDDGLTASDEVVITVEAAPKPRRPAA